MLELSSPSLPAACRKQFEQRIIAGEDIPGREIARARGKMPKGRPKAFDQSSAGVAIQQR